MIAVISPAKTLDFETGTSISWSTIPEYLSDSQKIINVLKKLSSEEVQTLMNISGNLADLNLERYAAWSKKMETPEAKQALLAFKGDVYIGLDAASFTVSDLEFAQDHLRILSGLHGLLRPMDLIRPYRLEMGTKLPVNGSENLYKFWGSKITKLLNKALKEAACPVLINLASDEYFKSIQPKELKAKVIKPVFKDFKNDKYKVISFFAKKARGMMGAYMIKNRLADPEQLKLFDWEGYAFNEPLSNKNEWVFTRG
ncbi:peroxide stress protein YaaA [Rapidithrix thailandica]|uniref:UPF0246 protein AAG747_12250 n=1 Tax=Rapidithrix thailandica TaxID=413964 RepID=A0AAW9RY29_9BACT